MVVYYNQEDQRWKNTMYSGIHDPKQTIGLAGCGPTSFAMVASTFLNRTVLPTETAKYSVDHGFRTTDSGTSWGLFPSIAKAYGLTCVQTYGLDTVKRALGEGALAIASMKDGHFTRGGHFILLVGAHDGVIEVYDPNMNNNNYTRKYGNDGLVDQGIKDDGKVRAKESVFRNEARSYWIFTKPIAEEDQPMTASEKAAFDALAKRVDVLEKKVGAPDWFVKEFGAAAVAKINNPFFTEEGWRAIAVALRINKA